MANESLELPVGPDGARIFFGYRAARLAPATGDDATTLQRKRAEFFTELGTTFMPGTPLMQAPVGLAAYVPAVIDPAPGDGVPDEVAIIVYASRQIYDGFRETSLSRRMYTRTHYAAFDMVASGAEFPGPLEAPKTRRLGDAECRFACAGDAAVDWQSGHIRVLLIKAAAPTAAFQDAVVERLRSVRGSLGAGGADQILAGIAPGFAALFIHVPPQRGPEADRLDVVPAGASVFRELAASAQPVIGDADRGVKINGACAFTFRFQRYLEHFAGQFGP